MLLTLRRASVKERPARACDGGGHSAQRVVRKARCPCHRKRNQGVEMTASHDCCVGGIGRNNLFFGYFGLIPNSLFACNSPRHQ